MSKIRKNLDKAPLCPLMETESSMMLADRLTSSRLETKAKTLTLDVGEANDDVGQRCNILLFGLAFDLTSMRLRNALNWTSC